MSYVSMFLILIQPSKFWLVFHGKHWLFVGYLSLEHAKKGDMIINKADSKPVKEAPKMRILTKKYDGDHILLSTMGIPYAARRGIHHQGIHPSLYSN